MGADMLTGGQCLLLVLGFFSILLLVSLMIGLALRRLLAHTSKALAAGQKVEGWTAVVAAFLDKTQSGNVSPAARTGVWRVMGVCQLCLGASVSGDWISAFKEAAEHAPQLRHWSLGATMLVPILLIFGVLCLFYGDDARRIVGWRTRKGVLLVNLGLVAGMLLHWWLTTRLEACGY